jgi:hypothetical protein
MRKDRKKAFKLRKQGKSYSEIKQFLGVPKSTLADWFSKTEWSTKLRETLSQKAKKGNIVRLQELNAIRGERLAKIYQKARNEAQKEFKKLKFYPLFIAGVAIYWGEGDKTSKYHLKIANTDPGMIKLFVKFLYKVCGVPKEKIRAHLLLYPDLNPDNCKDYWIQQSGLSNDNFTKSTVIQGKHKTRRVQYGVCNIGVNSTYLKEKMSIWLDSIAKEFAQN